MRAPFLRPLAKIFKRPLPMLIKGVPIIFSGIMSPRLPETYNENLPQTIRGASVIEEKRKFIDSNRNA